MEASIGINGFGRTGRAVFRAVWEGSRSLRVVAINDPNIGPAYAAYLLKHDTVLGGISATIDVRRDSIVVDGHVVMCFQKADVARIPWGDVHVTHVIECSGVLSSIERATAHLQAGCSRVIVSTPNTDAPIYMVDVNDDTLKPSTRILGAGCASGLALAPILSSVNSAAGLESCTFVVVQPAGNDQPSADATNPRDWLAGRAASSIVPCASTTLRTLQKLLPPLIAGRVAGHSYRVPVAVGGVVDVVVRTEEAFTPDNLRGLWGDVSQKCSNYATVVSEPIVGVDVVQYGTLCVLEALSIVAVDDRTLQFRLWYDHSMAAARHLVQLINRRLLVSVT